MRALRALSPLLLAQLLGCGPTDPRQAPAFWSYSGRVEGTDVYLGAVVIDDRLHAFATDGHGAPGRVTTWFEGPADMSPMVAVPTSTLGRVLSSTLSYVRESNSLITGTIAWPNSSTIAPALEDHAFSIEARHGKLGLLRMEHQNDDQTVDVSAWIYLEDGSWRGTKPPPLSATCTCDAYQQRWCYYRFAFWSAGSCP